MLSLQLNIIKKFPANKRGWLKKKVIGINEPFNLFPEGSLWTPEEPCGFFSSAVREEESKSYSNKTCLNYYHFTL
jgi:hypothetical protein